MCDRCPWIHLSPIADNVLPFGLLFLELMHPSEDTHLLAAEGETLGSAGVPVPRGAGGGGQEERRGAAEASWYREQLAAGSGRALPLRTGRAWA